MMLILYKDYRDTNILINCFLRTGDVMNLLTVIILDVYRCNKKIRYRCDKNTQIHLSISFFQWYSADLALQFTFHVDYFLLVSDRQSIGSVTLWIIGWFRRQHGKYRKYSVKLLISQVFPFLINAYKYVYYPQKFFFQIHPQ